MIETNGINLKPWGRRVFILATLTVLALGFWYGGHAQAQIGELGANTQDQSVGQAQIIESNHLPEILTGDDLYAFQQAYLKASNPESVDLFGSDVAISGNTIVVGSCCEDSNSPGINGDQADNSEDQSGAVYVFVRNGDTWTQQAYIKASNPGYADGFGNAVAISGNTLVVGSDGEASSATGVNGDQADNSTWDSGAVYVFTRTGGVWSQQAYIKASNTGWNDHFGSSVAIDGDTLVVGAAYEYSSATGVNGDQADDSAPFSGAAYVFTRSAGVWSQQAYLKASNTEAGDEFGNSVSISGDTVVVAAWDEESSAIGVNGDQTDNSVSDAGVVYVYTRNEAGWSQQAYIKASNTDIADHFGISTSISGDTLVVGAYWEASSTTGVNGDQADNSLRGAGAAYVFTRSGENWSQQAYLKASNTDEEDYFGYSVAIYDNTLVVGARSEDSNAIGMDGNQADNSEEDAGAAYVFTRNNGAWRQYAYLKASNTDSGDGFGSVMAISDVTLVVGASPEDSNATGVNGDQADNSVTSAGAAYVYTVGIGGSVCASGCEHTSIQAAIDDASDGDTIKLAGESFTETVTINKSLTILGEGREDTIIQAANAPGIAASGVIRITSGVTVTIEHVSIRFGNQDGDFGGGIYNAGNLTLAHSDVYSNATTISGGGIASFDEELTLIDVDVFENHSNYMGGGVFLGSLDSARLTAVNISRNKSSGHGGGIFIGGTGFQSTIENSTLISNTAGNSGGGIYIDGSPSTAISVTNSLIQANTATNKGGGIAIELGDCNLRIRTSRIENNQASTGGGVFIDSYQFIGDIKYTSIRGNRSTGNSGGGGGISFSGTAGYDTLKLNSSTISANTSQDDGGGLDIHGGDFTSTNSTYSGNFAKGNGGGIAFSHTLANLKSLTITENQADTDQDNTGDGGGLYRRASAQTITVTNSIIADNLDQSTFTLNPVDCSGDFTSFGYNIIGNNLGCTGWIASDNVGSPVSPVDPMLLPLADNGGPTWTHALEQASPAVDSNLTAPCPAKDQRGVRRPKDGDDDDNEVCDIGAFELGTCNNPVTPVVNIARDDQDIVLSWNKNNANREYVIARVTDYVQVTDLVTKTVYTGSYTDYGAIGDPLNNYVYIVRGENACGVRSSYSNAVAEYDFRLAKQGSAEVFASTGILRRLHFALISLPLEGANLPTTADGVADYIDPGGSVKGVAKWNTKTTSWIVRRVGNPFGTPDFAVAPGDVLMLAMIESAPDTFAWIGDIPADGSIQNNLVEGAANAIIVPLDQSGEFTMTAEGLAADIGGVTVVGAWSTYEQRWYIRLVGKAGTNFPIRPGRPYGIGGKTLPLVWP